ncbi:MAG: ATP-binding cassette domain-containing protein [Pseudomonadota bacterium]
MVDTPLRMTEATKKFGWFTAVDSLSFTVPDGRIVGFLGPNGAGKSTSLRMALGVMQPDRGDVSLFGAPPNLQSLKRVGFLPEERGLYKKMTPRAIIAYFAQLKGMDGRDARARADELLEIGGLGHFAKSKVSKLSKGMAQKVQILSSLAHRPDFLILDEPFSGLDPMNQQSLEELIRAEHERGATILFSTHVMEHAERLCDSIIMLAKGKKVFDGSLDEAYSALGRRARIAVDQGFDLAAALGSTGMTAELETGQSGEGPRWWLIALPEGCGAQEALRASIEAGAPISSFLPDQARLRDVFVALAGEAASEGLQQTETAEAEAA